MRIVDCDYFVIGSGMSGLITALHLASAGKVVAATDKPARFEVITAKGVVKKGEGTSITWEVTPDAPSKGPRVDVFARVKAYAADGCGETLYSQPFMLF